MTESDNNQKIERRFHSPMEEWDPVGQFIFLIGLFIFMALFLGFFGQAVLKQIYGEAFSVGMSDFIQTHTSELTAIRLIQILTTICTFLVPALIFSKLKTNNSVKYILGDKKPTFRLLGFIPGIILFFLPLAFIIHELNTNIEFTNPNIEKALRNITKQGEEIINALLNNKSPLIFCINFLMIAILPAFCEEIFFRGALQKLIIDQSKNIHVGILISALIFSIIHGDIYGFFPRAALGIIFGYLVVWGGSIWYSIFAHFIWNGLQAAFMYYALFNKNINMESVDINSISPTKTLLFTILFFIFTIFFLILLFTFHSISKQQNENYERTMD
jgi:hypothetical protein